MRSVLGALVVGGAVLAGEAQAQDAATPQVTLPAITVTGTNQQTTPYSTALPEAGLLRQPTTSVSVVDRKQIEMSSPSSITGILDQLPGVTVSRSGGIGGQAFVRGLNTNDFRVPLFVNGVRVRGRNTLQFLFFPPEDIERVEVIRGPASSLYGSDALGGLINIVTRRAEGDRNGPLRIGGAGIATTYGSNATTLNQHGDVEVLGEGLALRASINHRHGNNYQNSTGTIPNSDFETLGGAVALDYTLTPGQTISLDAHSERDSDGTAGAPGAPFTRARNDDNRLDQARINYTGNFTGGLISRVDVTAYINQFYTRQDTVNMATLRRTTFTQSDVLGPTVIGGRALAEIPEMILGGTAKTTIGADYNNEQRSGPLSTSLVTNYNAAGVITTTALSPTAQTGPWTQQTSLGFFAMQEWLPTPDWTLTGSLRYDSINTRSALSPLSATVLPVYLANNNVTDTALTGSAGVAYRPVKELELYANFGTSFRAPTTFDKYTSTVAASGTLFANPLLTPERGRTFELGYRVHMPKGSLNVAAFHSEFTDFIATVQIGNGNTQKQNVGSVNFDGVESEGRWEFYPNVTLFGAATALQATNITTGLPQPYIAPVYGNVGLQYAPPASGISLIGKVDWAVAKTRIDPAQEYPTGGYAVLNLFANFNLSELTGRKLGDTTVAFGLENVFDTYYQRGSTVPSTSFPYTNTNPLSEPGRNFTVTLRTRF